MTENLIHLYKSAYGILPKNPCLSHYLTSQIQDLSHELGIEIAEKTEKTMCSTCSILLVPGITAKVHIQSIAKRLKTKRKQIKARETFHRKCVIGKNSKINEDSLNDDDKQHHLQKKQQPLNQIVYTCLTCLTKNIHQGSTKEQRMKINRSEKVPQQSSYTQDNYSTNVMDVNASLETKHVPAKRSLSSSLPLNNQPPVKKIHHDLNQSNYTSLLSSSPSTVKDNNMKTLKEIENQQQASNIKKKKQKNKTNSLQSLIAAKSLQQSKMQNQSYSLKDFLSTL